MYRKTVLPVILKAVNTAKVNFYVSTESMLRVFIRLQTEESDDYKPRVKEEDIKLFRTVFCLAKKLQPSDMINTFVQLQSLNEVNLQYQDLSWDSIKDIQSCISDTIQRSIIKAVLNSQFLWNSAR